MESNLQFARKVKNDIYGSGHWGKDTQKKIWKRYWLG